MSNVDMDDVRLGQLLTLLVGLSIVVPVYFSVLPMIKCGAFQPRGYLSREINQATCKAKFTARKEAMGYDVNSAIPAQRP